MGKLDITRRDFLNGFALSVAVGSALSPLELMAMEAKQGSPYPPELIGLRGKSRGFVRNFTRAVVGWCFVAYAVYFDRRCL